MDILIRQLHNIRQMLTDHERGALKPEPSPFRQRHGYQFMPPRSQKKRRIRARRMRAAGRRVR